MNLRLSPTCWCTQVRCDAFRIVVDRVRLHAPCPLPRQREVFWAALLQVREEDVGLFSIPTGEGASLFVHRRMFGAMRVIDVGNIAAEAACAMLKGTHRRVGVTLDALQAHAQATVATRVPTCGQGLPEARSRSEAWSFSTWSRWFASTGLQVGLRLVFGEDEHRGKEPPMSRSTS